MAQKSGKLLMAVGVIIISLSLANLIPFDAYPVETYRGYTIYYDLEDHLYHVLGQTFSTVTLAKAAIDLYLGPPPPTNRAPLAECDGPYSATTGVSRNFYSTGSFDPDGDTLSYAWTFGDGGTATGSSPGHKYTKSGSYTIKLTVKDPGGLTGSDTSSCVVTDPYVTPPPPPANVAPVANPGGPYNGKINDIIYFSGAGSYDTDGSIIGYRWDLGDTTILTGGSISHKYTVAGTYTISLRVTDDDGAVNTKTTICTIVDLAPAEGDWKINGKVVGPTGTIKISTRTINVEYVCVGGAEYISSVTVKVSKEGTEISVKNLAKDTANTWSGSQVLPDDGIYTIDGYIVYNGQSIKTLSITTETGAEPFAIELKTSAWFGLLLVFAGIIMDRRKHD